MHERKREKKDTKITIANYQRLGWVYKCEWSSALNNDENNE